MVALATAAAHTHSQMTEAQHARVLLLAILLPQRYSPIHVLAQRPRYALVFYDELGTVVESQKVRYSRRPHITYFHSWKFRTFFCYQVNIKFCFTFLSVVVAACSNDCNDASISHDAMLRYCKLLKGFYHVWPGGRPPVMSKKSHSRPIW